MAAEQGRAIEAHAGFVEQRGRDAHAREIGAPGRFELAQGLARDALDRLATVPATQARPRRSGRGTSAGTRLPRCTRSTSFDPEIPAEIPIRAGAGATDSSSVLAHSSSVKSSLSLGEAATATPSMRPGSGIQPPSGPDTRNGPCAEATGEHVRQLVADDRVRIGRRLHVDLAPPGLGDVRAGSAHQPAFFAFVREQEGRHAGRTLDLEVGLVGAQLRVTIAREEQRVATRDAARILDVAARAVHLLPERCFDRCARAEVPERSAVPDQGCAAERRRQAHAREPTAATKALKLQAFVEERGARSRAPSSVSSVPAR